MCILKIRSIKMVLTVSQLRQRVSLVRVPWNISCTHVGCARGAALDGPLHVVGPLLAWFALLDAAPFFATGFSVDENVILECTL